MDTGYERKREREGGREREREREREETFKTAPAKIKWTASWLPLCGARWCTDCH